MNNILTCEKLWWLLAVGLSSCTAFLVTREQCEAAQADSEVQSVLWKYQTCYLLEASIVARKVTFPQLMAGQACKRWSRGHPLTLLTHDVINTIGCLATFSGSVWLFALQNQSNSLQIGWHWLTYGLIPQLEIPESWFANLTQSSMAAGHTALFMSTGPIIKDADYGAGTVAPSCFYRPQGARFNGLDNQKGSGAELGLNTTVASSLGCGDLCERNILCRGFSYESATGTCVLHFTRSNDADWMMLQAIDGWTFFELNDD